MDVVVPDGRWVDVYPQLALCDSPKETFARLLDTWHGAVLGGHGRTAMIEPPRVGIRLNRREKCNFLGYAASLPQPWFVVCFLPPQTVAGPDVLAYWLVRLVLFANGTRWQTCRKLLLLPTSATEPPFLWGKCETDHAREELGRVLLAAAMAHTKPHWWEWARVRA